MTILLDFNKLSPLITEQTLILTPNARTQKAIYAGQLSQLAENSVVESINVRSFSQWQDELWKALSFRLVLPKRLSNLAFKTWLEKVIQKESAWTLTNPSGVANKVLEAYQNMVNWQLDLASVYAEQSTEIDYFIAWIKKFNQFCQDKNLILQFECLDYISRHLDQCLVSVPQHLLLVGFNQLTPLQQQFFDTLVEKNIKVEKYDYKTEASSTRQISFTSLQHELEFAAQYAKEYQNKGGCVGVVVEQLANHLSEVHQAFSQEFQPSESKPWIPLSKPLYNVSAGFSLAEQPVVKTAMLLLNFKANRISLEELHFLKNTPLIDWGIHRREIQYFLHQLCLNARKNYSLSFLLKSIKEQDSPEKLRQLTIGLEHLEQSSNHKLSIEQHIESWRITLSIWGWAATESLNEFELQAKAMLLAEINQCMQLNDLYEKLSGAEAIEFLKVVLQQQTFQIASDRSNVHILGILEASGLQFDHLLVVGFTSQNWPQKNKINPFLPLEFQRKNNMPGSSAEREFDYAQDLSNSLLTAAKYVVVTASNSESNQSSMIAPFFLHLPVAKAEDFIDVREEKNYRPNYQWLDDSRVDLSDSNIRGGAYLLSEYAKCPFKSIATFQLKLTGYQMPEVGVEPKTKGSWLHESMEIIWLALNSQQELLALSNRSLENLVVDSLTSALEKHQAYLLATTDPEVVELELKKLAALILEWLTIEKQRKPFSVSELEASRQLNIGSLNLTFRVDRIDVNEKEQFEIIDYKTGKTELKNWFGARPTEAQMPAYILSMQKEKISALNYARLKTGEVAQLGLEFQCDDGAILKSEHSMHRLQTKPLIDDIKDFDDLVSQWRLSLSRIASGISDGYMPVSPKDPNQSCLFCDFKDICRINEQQPNSAFDFAEEIK